ncbi:hypothetical protein NECAME_12104 [Necator americanus]|uniref:Uncharacterized protein n=1 Tax=Necator americanus TaxID=51031 RepID=W2T1G1_NECAM|nr:hypothetical protein NECAME_12104 [Necator americanus]ETN75825.1 hypothetical protein NECAME_12104 [Necator americanus]
MSLNPKTCSVRANLCKKIEVVRQLFKAFHEKERGHKVRIRTTEEPKEGRKREPEDTLAKTEFEEVEVAKRPAVSSVRKRSTLRWKQDPGTAIGKKEVVSLLDGKVMPVEDLVQHREFRIARKIIDEVAKAKIIEKLLNEEDNATIRRLFETDLANPSFKRKESFGTKIVRRKSPSSLIKPDHRGEQAKKEKKDVETSLKHSKKIISAKKGDLKDSAGAATEKKIGQKIDVSEKKDSKISAAASIDRKIERRDQKPSKDYDYINTKELEDYLCELGDTEGAENVVKKKENEEKKMIVRDPHCIEAIIETYSMGVKNRADSKKEAQTTLQMGSSHKASTQKVDTEGKDVLLKNLCKTQEEESQMQYKIDHIAKSEQMSAQMKSSNKVSTQKVETWGTDALLKDLCKTQDHEPHEEHRKRCKTDLKLKREQMAAQVESTNKPSAQKEDEGLRLSTTQKIRKSQEDSKLFFGKHVKEPRQEQQGGTFGMMKGKEAEVSGNSMEKTKSKEKHRHKEGEAHEGGERDVRSPETLGGKRTKKGGSLELKKHEEKHSLPQINREAYGRNIEDKKETSKGNDQYKKEKHLERKDEVKVAAVKKESEGAATLKNEEKTEQKVKERKNEEESKTTDTLLKIVGSVTAMLREMLVPTKRDQGKVETDPEISLQKTQTDDERFIQSVDQKGQDRKDLECRPYAMELANTQEEITDSNQDKKPAKGTKAKESNKRQVIDFLKKDVEGKNTTQASPGSGKQIKIKNMKSKERGNEQSGRTTRNRSRGKQTDAAEKTRDMKGTGRKEEVIAEVKQQSENVPNETLKADIMQRIRKSKDSMRKIHSKKEDDNKKLTKERKVDSKGPAATSGRDSRSRKKSIPNVREKGSSKK